MSRTAAELPNTIAERRFEYSSDTSYKFWAISLDDRTLTIRFGKIGNRGQLRQVECPTNFVAKSEYLERIGQKMEAGYVEKKPPARHVVTPEAVWEGLADHEPFLQAILDDPDEIAGYAIYADWLTERQDPLGRFTQLQATMQDLTLPFYQRAKMEKEADQLRALHARTWLGNLTPWLMDKGIASYPYDFECGLLSSIRCNVLSLEFADQLRRSPYCRMLRELVIVSTEYTESALDVDGRIFDANMKFGLETLVGAEFSNLRDFRVGVAENEHFAEFGDVGSPKLIPPLISTMPRLETLYVVANINWNELFQIPLPHLRTLHVDLPGEQLGLLDQSGLLPQLHTLGLFSPVNDMIAKELVSLPGFSELAEIVLMEHGGLTISGRKKLEASGVVVTINAAPTLLP